MTNSEGRLKRCCIPGCKSTTRTMPAFKFPMQKRLSLAWESILRRKYPNIKLKRALDGRCHRYCCILHFEAKYLKSHNCRSQFAIPTLFTEYEIKTREPAEPISLCWDSKKNYNYKYLTLQEDKHNICKDTFVSIYHDHQYGQDITQPKLNFGELAELNDDNSVVDTSHLTLTIEQPISEVALSHAISYQKFRDVEWRNISYTETQNQFEAFPAFSALKLNNLLSVIPMQESDNILERCDLTLGAITNGLIQQRIAFESVLNSLPEEMKEKLGHDFITTNANFKNISDSLLQYVCGRRAEVIQDRREAFQPNDPTLKTILHQIPPSETHLFDDRTFTEKFQ